MKSNKSLIFLSLLLVLFLAIGSISASELNDTTPLDNSTGDVNDTNSSATSINSTDENNTNEIFIDYSSITKQYNTDNIIYKVKVYSIVNFEGVDYKYPIYKIPVKLRVYTGTSFKDYSTYTNYEGIASFKIPALNVGTHNLEIFVNDELKGSSYIKVNKATLKVYAPQITNKYRKTSYFEVRVTYGDKPVSKLTLKLKFYTGKRYTTYTIKTNSYGVAKLKLTNHNLGTHKIVIQSTNKKYKFTKYSKVIVKKSTSATKLLSLNYYKSGNNYYAKLTWSSKKGTKYIILRKLTGNFKVYSTVVAKSSKTSFTEKVEEGKLYTYSVRTVTTKKGKKVYGSYDKEGLKLIKESKVSVSFQNSKSIVSWTKVDGAIKYKVYRKIGSKGTYKCIATVDGNKLSYSDIYSNSKKDLSKLLRSSKYIDPSDNTLFYTVRPCWDSSVCGVKKISYGMYLKEGYCHLEAPDIVSLKNNTITWGNIPNAQGYLILKNNGTDNVWEIIGQANDEGTITQSLALNSIDISAYYAVQAYATYGEMIYSNYDKGFSLKDFSLDNSKYRILYVGDSITFGSPYYGAEKHIFSIPYRVAELLGCVYYNPSIPAATYHDINLVNSLSIENANSNRYRISREIVDAIYNGELPGNWKSLGTDKNSEGISNTKLEDYNIIVLCAGANDCTDNTKLGSINSNDVSTFNGALNHILAKIEQANKNRIANGEEPIKVIFANFYAGFSSKSINPNKLGLTVKDYQKELDKQYAKWKSQSNNLTFYKFDIKDYGIINQNNWPYSSPDNLHLTKFIYGQYGNAFAQFLVDNVFEDSTILN
ncbi:MAG: SGNH/GDSL hydrolase family protein [archaeon]|nr:SGNH/GDSL hydrolase family protein [archaeon]